MKVSYMIMMYISVYPIAISMRRTNVYEERSLGLHESHDESLDGYKQPSLLGSHLRRQLSFDLWYIFLGLFVLCITEGGKLQRNELDLFSAMFEVVSAYTTVGLSFGYPGVNSSLSSRFSTGGKLVIIAMQIRGCHRDLPYGLDRAILLPSTTSFEDQNMEADSNLRRLQTNNTEGTGASVSDRRGRGKVLLRSFLHPGPPVRKVMSQSTGTDYR